MLVVGYGDTQDEANKNHNENLLRLLKTAREINLKFNKKKLNLRRSEVKFMGHVLTSDGLKPEDKVKAVTEMPRPTTKQETPTRVCELPRKVLAALVGSCTASARANNKECKIRVVKPAR